MIFGLLAVFPAPFFITVLETSDASKVSQIKQAEIGQF